MRTSSIGLVSQKAIFWSVSQSERSGQSWLLFCNSDLIPIARVTLNFIISDGPILWNKYYSLRVIHTHERLRIRNQLSSSFLFFYWFSYCIAFNALDSLQFFLFLINLLFTHFPPKAIRYKWNKMELWYNNIFAVALNGREKRMWIWKYKVSFPTKNFNVWAKLVTHERIRFTNLEKILCL